MGNTISQGEAVYQATVMVCGEINGRKMLDVITQQDKEAIHQTVLQMFLAGITVHSKNPSPEALQKYVPGLVNNWLRKDKRLNGGNDYEPKNPGSRTGSGDKTLKNLKLLLAMPNDEAAKAEIRKAIAEREAELKAKATPTADLSFIPENLRHLVK